MRKFLILPIVAFGLIACGEKDPSHRDLDENLVSLNEEERLVYVMPDKFPNVIAFCDGEARVYITTRDMANPVVEFGHSNCSGGDN